MAPDPEALSTDAFLGGRLSLRQPRAGYRAGSDAVLLAAAVAARPGETVLELGCGVGVLGLCLAARCADVRVTGLELQPELAALARRNAADNGRAERVEIVTGDLADPPAEVKRRSFDHVVTNPPYFVAAKVRPPADGARARARIESRLGLTDWLAQGLKRLRPGGVLSLIQRPERLAEILAALEGPAGDIVLFPLWPSAGAAAGHVIVRAVKGRRGPLILARGLVLHGADEAFTPAAEDILRHGAALELG